MYQLPPTSSDDGDVLKEAYTEEDTRCLNFFRRAFKEARKLKSRWVKGFREPLADFSPTRGDKCSGVAGVRYFFRDFDKDFTDDTRSCEGYLSLHPPEEDYSYAAFLALWLSKFILPGPPLDGLSASVFPSAFLLSWGL